MRARRKILRDSFEFFFRQIHLAYSPAYHLFQVPLRDSNNVFSPQHVPVLLVQLVELFDRRKTHNLSHLHHVPSAHHAMDAHEGEEGGQVLGGEGELSLSQERPHVFLQPDPPDLSIEPSVQPLVEGKAGVVEDVAPSSCLLLVGVREAVDQLDDRPFLLLLLLLAATSDDAFQNEETRVPLDHLHARDDVEGRIILKLLAQGDSRERFL
mmetsp:Transcript_18697/g.42805  ORF Transcript_18697/g.42805 Transcript_18697/m.42805 type:complete len:210 (+) Transcript_18697:1304-1933(+)